MRIFQVALFLSCLLLVAADCSDLAGKTLSYDQCYESVTCSDYLTTVTGSYCAGGSFSFISTIPLCSPSKALASYTTVSSCILQYQPVNYCTGGGSYSTYTITAPIYPGTSVSSTTCYGTAPIIFQKVVTWKSGVYAGITGPAVATSSATTTSPSPKSIATQSPEATSTNNTVPIIVGVGVGVVVIIAGVVGFFFIRKAKSKPVPPSATTYAPPSLPGEYSQPKYPSGIPSSTGYYQPGTYAQPGQPGQPGYAQPGYPYQQPGTNYYPPSNTSAPYSPTVGNNEENSFIPTQYQPTQQFQPGQQFQPAQQFQPGQQFPAVQTPNTPVHPQN
ncbi:hypothetical protein HK096_006785 [Nowakowskiella sp. JEL0078]|nr:hypothetical protein HK096_006785 [Nowakowskiella sp. JEL0078]